MSLVFPQNKSKLIIESYYFFWLKILPRSNHISSMETMHFNCIFFFKEGYPDLLNILKKTKLKTFRLRYTKSTFKKSIV